MNLTAKFKWSIPQGIFSCHQKRCNNPVISIGSIHITNKTMMARIFLMILVSSFRLCLLNEDTVFQNDLCFIIDLNIKP